MYFVTTNLLLYAQRELTRHAVDAYLANASMLNSWLRFTQPKFSPRGHAAPQLARDLPLSAGLSTQERIAVAEISTPPAASVSVLAVSPKRPRGRPPRLQPPATGSST